MASAVGREISRNLRHVRLAMAMSRRGSVVGSSATHFPCILLQDIYNLDTVRYQPMCHWYSSSFSKELHQQKQDKESSISSQNKQLLHMTKAAVDRVRLLREKKGGDESIQLRLQVGGGGCSGFQYVFELDSKGAQENDHVIEVDGVQLLCDDISMKFVIGSTIDFESDLMMSKFVVSENPNAEIGCGCGSSFAVGDAVLN